MLQVWATDIGGYVIGTKFGQHKLTKISNKKTWEGVIGSISFCLGTSIILRKIIILYTPSIHFLILSIIICISSIIGDLIISKIKRINNIKDSGVFLPGHGGFLDRLDSLFFATPIYYFIISI